MKNVPKFENRTSTECKYEKESNSFVVRNGAWEMGRVCCTSDDSIASDIAKILIGMQEVGFEQGRRHVREALGIKGEFDAIRRQNQSCD